MTDKPKPKVVDLSAARINRMSAMRVVEPERPVHPLVAASIARGRERRKERERVIAYTKNTASPQVPPQKKSYVRQIVYSGIALVSLGVSGACLKESWDYRDASRILGYEVSALAALCVGCYAISESRRSSRNSNSYKE